MLAAVTMATSTTVWGTKPLNVVKELTLHPLLPLTLLPVLLLQLGDQTLVHVPGRLPQRTWLLPLCRPRKSRWGHAAQMPEDSSNVLVSPHSSLVSPLLHSADPSSSSGLARKSKPFRASSVSGSSLRSEVVEEGVDVCFCLTICWRNEED